MSFLDDNPSPFGGPVGWPGIGGDPGPQNVQQQYLEERRREENARLSKIYLDDAEFARMANAGPVREARKLSPLGDDLPKMAANAAYLAHRTGKQVTAQDYQLYRDGYAAQHFGQDKVDDSQFFDLVKGEFDLQAKKQAALRDLTLRMAGQSLKDAVSGIQLPATTVFSQWRSEHPEILDGSDDLPYLKAAIETRDEFSKELGKYAHLAGPGLDLLQKFTAGQAGDQDLYAFAEKLGQIPEAEREETVDKVVDLIAMAAENNQIDRGGLAQFARNLGQTFSRGFNFVPKSALQQKQVGVSGVLKALEAGTQVWVLPDGDLSKAVIGNANPDTGYEEPLNSYWREATPEERQKMAEGASQALSVFGIEHQLRAVADGYVDPIKRLAKPGSWTGTLEGGVYGVAGSLPYLSATGLNLFLGLAAYQATEYDRIRLENKDMDPRAAMALAGVEGAWQAALDKLQLKTLQGAFPVTGKLLGRIKSAGVRRTVGFAASAGEQFGQEIAQDVGTMAIDAVAAALRDDMPDQDLGDKLKDYWNNQVGETLVASIIFGLWGGGAVTARDIKASAAQLDEMARIEGISEAGRARMKAATTPEELDAVVRREVAAVTPEAKAAGALYAKAKFDAAQASQKDPEEPTVEIRKDGEKDVFRVLSPEGDTLIETPDASAAQAAFLDYRQAADTNAAAALKQAVAYWQAKHSGLEFKDAPPQLAKAEMDRLVAAQDAKGIEELRQRLIHGGFDPDGDLSGVRIFASMEVQDLGAGIYKGIGLLRSGAKPEDALEETNHFFVKRALMRGDVTLDWLAGQLERTTETTGIELPRGNEVEILESTAQVARDLFLGRIHKEQLPQGLVDYFRRLMRVVKEIFDRAIKVADSASLGDMDPAYEAFLMESLGMTPQQQVDAASDLEAARMMQEVYDDDMAEAAGDAIDILDAVREAGGLPAKASGKVYQYAGEIKRIREAQQGGAHLGIKGAFNLLRADAPDLDALIKDLQGMGFPLETPNDLFEMIERRLATGEPIYGRAARAYAEQHEGMMSAARRMYSLGRDRAPTLPRLTLAEHIEELQAGEPDPVDTGKTFWLIAASSGDIVEIYDNERDAAAYFQTTASPGEWLWEYKDGLRTRAPLLKRGVAERRAEGYTDTVRYEREKEAREALGAVFYGGADTSAETATSAGEIPGYTPDGRRWEGQEEPVVYHGGRLFDPQGTDPGGYENTQTLKPRRPGQTYLFSLGRERVQEALKGALDMRPGERLAMYQRAKATFERVAARRAAAAGDGGSPQDKYAKMLQGLWELDAILKVLPPEVRGRAGGYTSMAALGKDSANGPTLAAVDKFLAKRLDIVGRHLERHLAAEYRIEVERTLEAARPKAGESGVKRSTLGPAAQAFADRCYKASLLDNDAVVARQAAIEAALLHPDTPPEKAADLSEEWSALNVFGDLENRDSATLAAGLEDLRRAFVEGRAAWRLQESERVAANRAIARGIIEKLGKATTAKRFAPKSKLAQMLETLNDAGLHHASLEQFLRAILPDDALVAKWSDAARRADGASWDMELAALKGAMDAVKAGAREAGMSAGAAMRWFKREGEGLVPVPKLEGRKVASERLTIELAQKIVRGKADRGKFTEADLETLRDELAALPKDTRKKYVTIQRVIFAGAQAEVALSPAQAVQLLLCWRQPDIQAKMRREGWTDESAAALEQIADHPVSRAVLSFLREYYAANYGVVNPVYARMFAMNMPRSGNYAPARFVTSKEAPDVGIDGTPQASGSLPGFAKGRVTHSAPVSPMDALEVFSQHVAQVSHWTQFAELAREVRALERNLEFREALKQKRGEGALKFFGEWAALLEERGGNKSREVAYMGRILRSLVGGKAISLLGFNLKTMAMQLDSSMRFLLELSPRQVGAAMADPAGLADAMREVWASPTIRRRLEGGMNPAVQFLFTRSANDPGVLAQLGKAAMAPVNIFDAGATTISSAVVYRARFAEALAEGMPEGMARAAALDAADAAVARYSQPTGFTSKSLAENTGDQLYRSFMLFMSDPRLKSAVMLDAARQIAAGKNVAQNLQRIAAIEVMALVSHVVASAYKDAFSDDEDEDIWAPGGFARALALAPLQGYFLAGTVSEVVLAKLTGTRFFEPSRNPLLEAASNAERAYNKSGDLFGGEDFAATFKAWDALLRASAVTPSLGAIAAVANIVRPYFGWKADAEADE